jgi:hypothetical protein
MDNSPTSDVRALAAELTDLALASATEAAWRQWSTLGTTGLSSRRTTPGHEATIVDPEALLLASLALLPHERRFGDFLGWWAETGAALLSVQRTRTLLTLMPPELDVNEPTADALAAFAASASEAGDRRWRRYAAGAEPLERRPGKGAERPELSAPAALFVRLRAGFGVSAKTDLLAVLLGLRGRSATVKALAETTGYSTVTVRAAAEEMALARFAEDAGEYPTSYRISGADRWTVLFTSDRTRQAPHDIPEWGYWSTVYAVLLSVAAWGRRVQEEEWSRYVASSKARDLLERYESALRLAGHNISPPSDHRGTDFLSVFADTVRSLAGRAERSA